MKLKIVSLLAAGAVSVIMASPALAQIKACITVSATGLGASLGVPEQNTIALLPKEIGGQPVSYTSFDDATDPTAAAKNVRKCIEEQKADVLIGSSTTPTSIAVAGVAAETATPLITLVHRSKRRLQLRVW